MGRAIVIAAVTAIALAGVAAAQSPDELEVGYALAPPLEWRPIDELAATARAALQADGWIGGAEAWGDRTDGAFILVQELRSRALVGDAPVAARRLHDHWRAGLERDGAAITGWAVGEGRYRIHSVATFDRGPFTGAAHTYSMVDDDGALRAVSAVCFYRQSSRQRSRRRCAQLLDGFAPTISDERLEVVTEEAT